MVILQISPVGFQLSQLLFLSFSPLSPFTRHQPAELGFMVETPLLRNRGNSTVMFVFCFLHQPLFHFRLLVLLCIPLFFDPCF